MSIVSAKRSATARISLAEALDLGPSVWDNFLARSAMCSPFMSWGWHRAWAEGSEAEDVESARVVVVQSGVGELEALFPFRVYRTRVRRLPVTALGWAISDLGCPDHLELLALPEADLDAMVAELDQVPWDVIQLDNVADAAPNIERFCAACVRRGWSVRRTPRWRCPYIELPTSWEAYLASLSPNKRQAVRRRERKLRRERNVVLVDYGPAPIEDGWRHLTRLHALRWEGGGVLRDQAWERLHRWFASWLAERHQLWLTTLDVDGGPVAACYGFSFGDTIYCYQTGWDPRWRHCGVSMVLHTVMIRRAIERGYRRFDFLRGVEPYKQEWTSAARTCYEVVILRPGWRATMLRGLDWIARQQFVNRLREVAGTLRPVGKRHAEGDCV